MPLENSTVESVARAFIDAYHESPVFDSLYDVGDSIPRTRSLMGAEAVLRLITADANRTARRYEHALRAALDEATISEDVRGSIIDALGDDGYERRRANWDVLASDAYQVAAEYIDEDGNILTGFLDRKYGLNRVWLNGRETDIDPHSDSNLTLTIREDD